MDYKVVMPYLGGILSDNAYKIGRTKRKTHPMVILWMRELAEKAEALCIPQAESYRIGLYSKFWDERRPDLSNLHKVIGDALQRGLAINDKAFFFSDLGYELGKFEPELEITITPLIEKNTYIGVETGRITSEFLNTLEVSKDDPNWTAESLVRTFQEELNGRVLSDDRLDRVGLKRGESE